MLAKLHTPDDPIEEPPEDPRGGSGRHPLDDHGLWQRWLEIVGIDSLLVVLESRMSEALRGRIEVGDIWAETLWHAWRDRSQFTGTTVSHFRAWLLAIAMHRIHDKSDELNARKRKGNSSDVPIDHSREGQSDAGDHLVPGITTTPGRLAYYRERASLMQRALMGLPPEQETVLRLRLFEQEPMAEVARRLELNVATAWSRFRKAAATYRARLHALSSDSR